MLSQRLTVCLCSVHAQSFSLPSCSLWLPVYQVACSNGEQPVNVSVLHVRADFACPSVYLGKTLDVCSVCGCPFMLFKLATNLPTTCLDRLQDPPVNENIDDNKK